jgi:excisionase family DNA binding protein
MEQTERTIFDDIGACEYLRRLGAVTVTPNFVHTLFRSGELKAKRVGRKLHVSKADLDSWLMKKLRMK